MVDSVRPIDLIVIHCSATRPSLDVRAVDIDSWHKRRGWSGIGYHYVIRRNGGLEQGRPENEVGAHALNYNKRSIGVCLAGGVAEDGKTIEENFTGAQYETLKSLLIVLKAKFQGVRICGHRDLSPDLNRDGKITPNEWIKGCPSFDVAQWLAETGL